MIGKGLGRDCSYSVLMVSKIPLEDRGSQIVNQYLFEKTRFTDLQMDCPHIPRGKIWVGDPKYQKEVFNERFQGISTCGLAIQIPYSTVSEVPIQNIQGRKWPPYPKSTDHNIMR